MWEYYRGPVTTLPPKTNNIWSKTNNIWLSSIFFLHHLLQIESNVIIFKIMSLTNVILLWSTTYYRYLTYWEIILNINFPWGILLCKFHICVVKLHMCCEISHMCCEISHIYIKFHDCVVNVHMSIVINFILL